MDKHIEELKKAARAANFHGWTGFEDALNADGYSEAVSKFIQHCSPSVILKLIASQEAAQKLAQHYLDQRDAAEQVSAAALRDWAKEGQRAEAALSAANERVSQEYPETLPCPVRLEPGLRLGKGLPIAMLFRALSRRADYEAEIAAMTPEQRVEHDQRTREVKKFISECITPRPAGFTVEGSDNG
ncbi:hypothetical protein ACQ248_004366 [Yersinia enterocolitica]|uniref:hypothetical protein n=1 Tax=Yersinia enterocolitica TaxID=630 RepID=UPI00313D74F5